jgi:hypothetical protein
MTTPTLPIVLSRDGVDVLSSDEPGHYEFIPPVQPELSPSGDPTLLLVKQEGGAWLQMGVQLTVDEPVLKKIAEALKPVEAAAHPTPTPITLTPVHASVDTVRLLLTTGVGDQVLCEAQASGMPPYTALLRATLTPDQTKAVEEALAGKQKRLRAVYELKLARKAGAHASIRGAATEAIPVLTAEPSVERAASWVEEALTSGTLSLSTQEWGIDAGRLLASAVTEAKGKAATLVFSMQGGAPVSVTNRTDQVVSEVRLEEPRVVPTRREGDLAGWFKAGRKPATLTASAEAPKPGATTSVTLKLGFDPTSAPIAFIEVTGHEGPPTVLRAPAWQPVMVNASGKVSLTVRYSTGAPPFTTEIAADGGERLLQMNELGLVRVTLDASAKKASGATQARVVVNYLRGGQTVESWPVPFRFGDWTDAWFLVTGARDLNGVLEYHWQATKADGSIETGGPTQTDQPTVVIS